MSQHSEELRAKVREALLGPIRKLAAPSVAFGPAGRLADALQDTAVLDVLADGLSAGIAAAIDAADTEAWLHDDFGTEHLNRILDALKDQ